MDFSEIQLGENDNVDLKKERRFSVHDVEPTDNEVPYGQPDNEAMTDISAMRITSIEDDSDTKRSIRMTSNTSDSNNDDDDQNANVFIHENVDNNYEEFGPGHIADDYAQSPNLDAARGSKEASPEQAHDSKKTKDDTEYPSHYRHPSLPADENPASDDEDLDKDHIRYVSTLIHDTVESDYEDTPADEQDRVRSLYQKNVSRLHDYWCHSSSGIAIEDDTDAKQSRDKADNVDINHNIKGSVHEINNYTRPFMSKIEDNNEWDSVFGHGIISDTHNKYISNENGHFIEWMIEVNNMNMSSNKNENMKSSVVIGISSDLLGQINDSDDGLPFTYAKHGFGFDNLGNIMNGTDITSTSSAIRSDDDLHFDSRDVVHIILDYSDSNNWIFYAKVGDIEDADYDDLDKAAKTNKITTVFDSINPGSFRLAVSTYSQMDALIIESCKIHGNEKGSFYQELKSYSIDHTQHKEDEEAKEDEENTNQIETETDTEIKDDDQLKLTQKKEDEEEKVNEFETEDVHDIQTVDAPEETSTRFNRAMTVIIKDDDEEESTPENTASRPSTNQIETVQENENENENENEKKSTDNDKLKPFLPQKSVVIHDEGDQIKIEQQTKSIDELKQQIQELKRENEEKQKRIDETGMNESKHKERMKELEKDLNEYREKAESAQEKVNELQDINEKNAEKERERKDDLAKMTQLTEENERLNHELKLAQDRLKSLDDTKQEIQQKLKNAVDTKIKLIISTSEEIDHYRKLIQQIASNKLGCQLLSDLAPKNGRNINGYY